MDIGNFICFMYRILEYFISGGMMEYIYDMVDQITMI